MNESEIIQFFFASLTGSSNTLLGIGDDAAVVEVAAGQQLLVSTDTLVSGVHFFPQQPAAEIAHKALAVNLSDMAAMAAQAKWFTLSLTLPEFDQDWLSDFCQGLKSLAERHQLELIGGDLSRGPLAISITIHGVAPKGQYLTRQHATIGDLIWVSGNLGDAGLVLQLEQHNPDNKAYADIRPRLTQPEPRVELGLSLRDIASSMIDLSDGLGMDLGRILTASQVGARVYVDSLPLSPTLQRLTTPEQALHLAVSAGDDYELCFTAEPGMRPAIEAIESESGLKLTCIGEISEADDLLWLNAQGKKIDLNSSGFQHFV